MHSPNYWNLKPTKISFITADIKSRSHCTIMALGRQISVNLIGSLFLFSSTALMVWALINNMLFEVRVVRQGTTIVESVRCRWDRKTFEDGTEDQLYKDNLPNDWHEMIAGRLWLASGIASATLGFAGLCACLVLYRKKVKWLKYTALICTFLAGGFALGAWASTFFGWEKNTCAKNKDSHMVFSIPAAFVCAFKYWFGIFLVIFVDRKNQLIGKVIAVKSSSRKNERNSLSQEEPEEKENPETEVTA